MPVGKVKWFDVHKGFGFIEGDEATGGDVFVHFSVIEGDGFRCLCDQQLVEYEMARGPKGLMATRAKALPVDGKPKKNPPRFGGGSDGADPDAMGNR